MDIDALFNPIDKHKSACNNACMTALQIRDVPEELHRQLVEDAAEEGVSLQKYLLRIIKDGTRLASQQRAIKEILDAPSLNISHEENMRIIYENRKEREERFDY
jgi:putative aminopeptidase FrvX